MQVSFSSKRATWPDSFSSNRASPLSILSSSRLISQDVGGKLKMLMSEIQYILQTGTSALRSER